jgi:hypothetical protein
MAKNQHNPPSNAAAYKKKTEAAEKKKNHREAVLKMNTKLQDKFKQDVQSQYTTPQMYKKYLKKTLSSKTLTQLAIALFLSNYKGGKLNEDDKTEITTRLEAVRVDQAGRVTNADGTETYKHQDQFKFNKKYKVKAYIIAAFAYATTEELKKLQKGSGKIVVHHLFTLKGIKEMTQWKNKDMVANFRCHTGVLKLMLKPDHDCIQCELENRDYERERDHIPVTDGVKYWYSLRAMCKEIKEKNQKFLTRAAAVTKANEDLEPENKKSSINFSRSATLHKNYSSAPHAYDEKKKPSIARDMDGEKFVQMDIDALHRIIGNGKIKKDSQKLKNFIRYFRLSNMGRVSQSDPTKLTKLVMLKAQNSYCNKCKGVKNRVGNCGIGKGRRSPGPPPHGDGYGEQTITGKIKVRLPQLFAAALMPKTVNAAFCKVNNDPKRVNVVVNHQNAWEFKPILKKNMQIEYKTNQTWKVMANQD